MSLTLLNEKVIRKVVRPQLEAVYPAQTAKEGVRKVVEFLACTDPRRLNAAVPALTQQLSYIYGENEQNRGLAVRMLTAVFHDEDY